MKKIAEKHGEMTHLLNEVDSLCSQLHDSFQTISANHYEIFAPELQNLIFGLKVLMKESPNDSGCNGYDKRLERQISDLEELEHDFKVFKVDAQKNESLKKAMENIKNLDFSKLVKI